MSDTLKNLANSVILFHFIIFIISILFLFDSNFTISADATIGAYAFPVAATITTILLTIVGVIILLALVGLDVQVVGTGVSLNDVSTQVIVRIICWAGLWIILSSVTLPILNTIPNYGFVIYSIMTIIFTINLLSVGDN